MIFDTEVLVAGGLVIALFVAILIRCFKGDND